MQKISLPLIPIVTQDKTRGGEYAAFQVKADQLNLKLDELDLARAELASKEWNSENVEAAQKLNRDRADMLVEAKKFLLKFAEFIESLEAYRLKISDQRYQAVEDAMKSIRNKLLEMGYVDMLPNGRPCLMPGMILTHPKVFDAKMSLEEARPDLSDARNRNADLIREVESELAEIGRKAMAGV